jgi:hypothetical protein
MHLNLWNFSHEVSQQTSTLETSLQGVNSRSLQNSLQANKIVFIDDENEEEEEEEEEEEKWRKSFLI